MKNLPLKEVFYFSLPLVGGQIGQMLFGIIDIIVVGRYSNEAVSALGVAVGIMAPFLMVGLGLTFAVSALTAQKRGAKKEEEGLLFNALLISFVIGTFLSLSLIFIGQHLHWFQLIPVVAVKAKIYLQWASFSIPFALLFQVYKEYLQAHGKTIYPMVLIFLFNGLNLLFNILLVFGIGPFPEFGILGTAIATLLGRALMFLLLAYYTSQYFSHKIQYNLNTIKEILSLGLPVGIGTLTEVLVFSTVTVLIGQMSIVASASHNIVLNMASLTFMVPLAINSASSVFVAENWGKKDLNAVKSYAFASLLLSLSFMIFTAFTYIFFAKSLMRLATNDESLISYGSALLFYVALFQIPDGLQATLWGILRGMGQTKIPMMLSLLLNWGMGLPFGLFLVYVHHMEAAGYWAGLSLGLYLMCLGLGITFYHSLKFPQKSDLVLESPLNTN